jgi:two-component system, chemotaxis family, response regulator Rcp1
MNIVHILLVEDSPGDARLIFEALKESKLNMKISIAIDGVEALAFLKHEGKYAGSLRPDIMLLDLNLPRKDGRELLDEIKNDNDLKSIPVLVLTTSSSRDDIIGSYQHHANSYITKPADMDEFLEVVRSVENFWFDIAKLPSHDSNVSS